MDKNVNDIIISASVTQIPPSLLTQLKPGGKLVLALGLAVMKQELLLVKKDKKNKLSIDSIFYVQFLPLLNNTLYAPVEAVN
ncbi:MAG: hypothetical protein OEY11_04745 [Gammaproteobacteria bacterium]|nr:hypothetical protein [Gammaproteobacteria bacterium]